jgi:hypothetical protein
MNSVFSLPFPYFVHHKKILEIFEITCFARYYSFPEKYFSLESKIYLGSSKLKFGLWPKSLSGILYISGILNERNILDAYKFSFVIDLFYNQKLYYPLVVYTEQKLNLGKFGIKRNPISLRNRISSTF